jgi:hypothetical protein
MHDLDMATFTISVISPDDYSTFINYPFSNGFVASTTNYKVAMSLAGMQILQNDTNLKYLKLFPNNKLTTAITLNLRLNQTKYYTSITTYLIVID